MEALLIMFVEHYYIVQSWGIAMLNRNGASIKFYVSGFKYVGMVNIRCVPNGYIITFQESLKVFVCVTPECVISVLDNFIEYSDDYEDILRKWLAERL